MSIPKSASNLIYLLLEEENVRDKRVYLSMAKKRAQAILTGI